MKDCQLSDSKLLSIYVNGDEEAFASLVNRHKNRVFTTIYLIVKDRHVAEDLLQDVFVKAVKTINSGRYNEEGKFLPWLLRISHNIAVDHFRKMKRNPVFTADSNPVVMNSLHFSEEPVELDNIKKETKRKLRELIRTLPQPQKEVLIMRHFANMSFKEIADSTGVSINTALGRMRYALINLRKKMEEQNIAYDENYYPK